MPDVMSFSQLAALFKDYGPFGILVVIWFFDIRQMRNMAKDNKEMADKHRSEVMAILSEHKEYMVEQRRMYDNNVLLVDNYQAMAKDQRDIIIMNTTALTRVQDDIKQNQFCPVQRVDKQSIQVRNERTA